MLPTDFRGDSSVLRGYHRATGEWWTSGSAGIWLSANSVGAAWPSSTSPGIQRWAETSRSRSSALTCWANRASASDSNERRSLSAPWSITPSNGVLASGFRGVALDVIYVGGDVGTIVLPEDEVLFVFAADDDNERPGFLGIAITGPYGTVDMSSDGQTLEPTTAVVASAKTAVPSIQASAAATTAPTLSAPTSTPTATPTPSTYIAKPFEVIPERLGVLVCATAAVSAPEFVNGDGSVSVQGDLDIGLNMVGGPQAASVRAEIFVSRVRSSVKFVAIFSSDRQEFEVWPAEFSGVEMRRSDPSLPPSAADLASRC